MLTILIFLVFVNLCSAQLGKQDVNAINNAINYAKLSLILVFFYYMFLYSQKQYFFELAMKANEDAPQYSDYTSMLQQRLIFETCFIFPFIAIAFTRNILSKLKNNNVSCDSNKNKIATPPPNRKYNSPQLEIIIEKLLTKAKAKKLHLSTQFFVLFYYFSIINCSLLYILNDILFEKTLLDYASITKNLISEIHNNLDFLHKEITATSLKKQLTTNYLNTLQVISYFFIYLVPGFLIFKKSIFKKLKFLIFKLSTQSPKKIAPIHKNTTNYSPFNLDTGPYSYTFPIASSALPRHIYLIFAFSFIVAALAPAQTSVHDLAAIIFVITGVIFAIYGISILSVFIQSKLDNLYLSKEYQQISSLRKRLMFLSNFLIILFTSGYAYPILGLIAPLSLVQGRISRNISHKQPD